MIAFGGGGDEGILAFASRMISAEVRLADAKRLATNHSVRRISLECYGFPAGFA